MASPMPPSAPVIRPRQAGTARPVMAVIAVVALVACAIVAVGFVAVRDASRQVPAFASLAEAPDPSLHGTVAYFADASRCVRVVAAAGRPARDVLCLPDQEAKEAQTLGKLLGPQLVWRQDGRLEVTMFRMTDPPGPSFNPGWQKLVDVRTGSIEDVAPAEVPSVANVGSRAEVNPSGQRITAVSDDGRIEVAITDGSTSRTLLSAEGPGHGTYRLYAAFWAPDGDWIAADDGRILIITPGDPAVTRVLTDESSQVTFDQARFAVTSADLLGP